MLTWQQAVITIRQVHPHPHPNPNVSPNSLPYPSPNPNQRPRRGRRQAGGRSPRGAPGDRARAGAKHPNPNPNPNPNPHPHPNKAPDASQALLSGDTLGAAKGGYLEYEQPNNRLYTFEGTLSIAGSAPLPIDANATVLRGSVLRNTAHVIGLVIYAGEVHPHPHPHPHPLRS